jgi:ribosome-associated protein
LSPSSNAGDRPISSRPKPRQTRATQLLALIRSSLEEDKAEDVVVIDLAGKTEIADWMVVCSGRSARQVGAIADKLVERLKAAGQGRAAVEGKQTGDWVLVDAGDIVVHVFRPEIRQHYSLEKMWSFEIEGAGPARAKRARKRKAEPSTAADDPD